MAKLTTEKAETLVAIKTTSSVERVCTDCGVRTYAIDMFGTLNEAYCIKCYRRELPKKQNIQWGLK